MKNARKILGYGLLIALVGLLGVTWWQKQQLADWLALRSYQAPTDVSQLTGDATMTSSARRLFYINHPQLQGRTEFNQSCTDKSEQSVVLGCYHGDRQGIFLYQITDARLQGVMQVTAAHEMLHQAYDRLSSAERKRIDGLLEAFYAHGLTDPMVKEQLNVYKKTEPSALDNEMHSLFGTEVASLPPALETYYQRYFANRARVVAYNTAYQSEFTKRKDQVAAYDVQLAQLKEVIAANEHSLDTQQSTLKQLKAQLDSESSSNDVDAYNAGVATYNRLAQTFNQQLAATRQRIGQYNAIVEQRNAIAVQEQQLQQALDSRLTPVGGQ